MTRRPAPPAAAAPALSRDVVSLPAPDNPRVQVISSSPGTIHIVGVTLSGDWVAEYKCLVEDFDDLCVTRMEQKVRSKERHRPTRVLEFSPR